MSNGVVTVRLVKKFAKCVISTSYSVPTVVRLDTELLTSSTGSMTTNCASSAYGTTSSNCDSSAGKQTLDCEVLIIGSGFAGTYAAYQLSPRYGDRLCLVEKLHRDGGRMIDFSETPGGPVIGGGPLRLMDTQTMMLALAATLGIKLEVAPYDVDMYKTRDRHYIANYTS